MTGFGFYIWKRAGNADSVTALDCKRQTLKKKGCFTQIGCDCRGASSNFADERLAFDTKWTQGLNDNGDKDVVAS